MPSFSGFRRSELSSESEKAQFTSTVKYFINLVTRKKSHLVSKDDYTHPSLQPQVPNIRQRSVVSNHVDDEEDLRKMEEKNKRNEVRRKVAGYRASSTSKENKGGTPTAHHERRGSSSIIDLDRDRSYIKEGLHPDRLQHRESPIPFANNSRVKPSYNQELNSGSPVSSSSSMRSSVLIIPTRSERERERINGYPNSMSSVNYQPHQQNYSQGNQVYQGSPTAQHLQHPKQGQGQLLTSASKSPSSPISQISPITPITYPRRCDTKDVNIHNINNINNINDINNISTVTNKATVLCCDKCDGKHETDDCPYYKKKREGHIDAQKNGWKLVGGSSNLPGGSCLLVCCTFISVSLCLRSYVYLFISVRMYVLLSVRACLHVYGSRCLLMCLSESLSRHICSVRYDT